jgi:hypothetical protein
VRFQIDQRFKGALADVEDAYVDPAFIALRAGLPKIGGAELLGQQVDGDIVRQRIHYVFTAPLSGAVRAVIDPDRLTWVEESTVDRAAHRTEWRIVPDHYKERLKASGVSTLTADGDGTRRLTTGTVEVPMPLVGGRVERAIVEGLQEYGVAEAAAVERFLTEQAG